jgi:hypothetical protein
MRNLDLYDGVVLYDAEAINPDIAFMQSNGHGDCMLHNRGNLLQSIAVLEKTRSLESSQVGSLEA